MLVRYGPCISFPESSTMVLGALRAARAHWMQELVRPPAAAQPGLVHVKVQAMRFTAAAAVRPPDKVQPTRVKMLMHIR